jgi:hypothetical protein
MLLIMKDDDEDAPEGDDDDDENGDNDNNHETIASPLSTRSSNSSLCGYSNSAQSFAYSYSSYEDPLQYTDEELLLSDSIILPASDCRDKNVWIVTTAALPWFTGTAVNPLLRAAYWTLYQQEHCEQHRTTTLVVPWLEESQDRLVLYGAEWQDASMQQQEDYIRNWLRDDAQLPLAAARLKILFYPARYHESLQSIFAMGDFCERLEISTTTRHQDSVCILEEPEHVNFYRAPGRNSWRSKFPHVIGIVHTNYKAYVSQHSLLSNMLTAPLVGVMSAFMVRAYCDKVIKLSDVLQEYAPEKQVTCNVHGVRQAFLSVDMPTGSKVYFIGKLLWAKGLDKLLELQAYYKKHTGDYFEMTIYGSGAEADEIQQAFLGTDSTSTDEPMALSSSSLSYAALSKYYYYSNSWNVSRQPLPVSFPGRQDHATLSTDYKIFVNPSVTEVLCTTTAEAIAMNKFVIIPDHPSNNGFLASFPNVLRYKTSAEFVQYLQYAMTHAPTLLSDDLRYTLTWEAATMRLLQAATITERDAARRERIGKKYDETIAKWHYQLGKGSTGDVLRKVLGGGPVAEQYKYQTTITSSSSCSNNKENEDLNVSTRVVQ